MQRTKITFSGYEWQIKSGTGLGPGNNNWSDSDENVWIADKIVFQSWHGHTRKPKPGTDMQQWIYTGDDIPRPSTEKVHINIWLLKGQAPKDGKETEVVVSNVSFRPLKAL